MENYAGVNGCDNDLEEELTKAGITPYRMPHNLDGEIPTRVCGTVGPWLFKRAWTYWIATGPGLPLETSEKLHSTHGKVVRVAGHCGCPSPKEWGKGFSIGLYHVDTQEGLKALADAIKDVMVTAV